MTKEQLSAEYKWLLANRKHPEFRDRCEKYNSIIRKEKREIALEAKNKAKEFKVGEVVKINHPKATGLWKIEEVKVTFLVLKNIETRKTVKAKATLLEKIEEEMSDLISDLDEIGLY